MQNLSVKVEDLNTCGKAIRLLSELLGLGGTCAPCLGRLEEFFKPVQMGSKTRGESGYHLWPHYASVAEFSC